MVDWDAVRRAHEAAMVAHQAMDRAGISPERLADLTRLAAQYVPPPEASLKIADYFAQIPPALLDQLEHIQAATAFARIPSFMDDPALVESLRRLQELLDRAPEEERAMFEALGANGWYMV